MGSEASGPTPPKTAGNVQPTVRGNLLSHRERTLYVSKTNVPFGAGKGIGVPFPSLCGGGAALTAEGRGEGWDSLPERAALVSLRSPRKYTVGSLLLHVLSRRRGHVNNRVF